MIDNKERLYKDGKTFTITHNLKGSTFDDWVRQFKANELLRARKRKDSIILTHEILSWHREDAKNLTLQKMQDMTHQYIRYRNPKGIFVAVPHFDKKHFHVHLCASGVEYKTGKSMRLSKTDLQNVKKGIEEFQKTKFPELIHSEVKHDQIKHSGVSEREHQFTIRTERESDRAKLTFIIDQCFRNSYSKDDFVEALKSHQIESYYRSGKLTGAVFNGRKFRINRLGFSLNRLDEFVSLLGRENELRESRSKKIDLIDISK